jgi:predicted carbohydrate-binding protein with CBM5 and CBM33 domain
MSRKVRVLLSVPLLLVVVVVTAVVASAGGPAAAHGGTIDPPTRTYTCRFLEPGNPACAAAWSANPQALYDWMEVNLGDVAGRHQERIPDGQLCSAGREKYAAFDDPRTDWPATPVSPGHATVTYEATAPHATSYFRYYLTVADFDASQPLRWADLGLLYDSGPLAALPSYQFPLHLPERTGRHLLYVVWQRSDSPEAFYSCSDVDFGDGSGSPSTTSPPTTSPGTTVPGSTTTTLPPGGTARLDLPAVLRTQSDWGTGYCVDATVTNPGAIPAVWSSTIPLHDTVTSSWNAVFHPHHGSLHVEGEVWNAVLEVGGSTNFGYCATRGAAPPTTSPTTTVPAPTTTVPSTTVPPTTTTTVPPTTVPPGAPPVVQAKATTTVTDRWDTGYCARVKVRNQKAHDITWKARVRVVGKVTSLWDAKGPVKDGILVVKGEHWNPTLAPGATTTFGFCASSATG